MFVRVRVIREYMKGEKVILIEFTGPGHSPETLSVTPQVLRELGIAAETMGKNPEIRKMEFED